ncbi:MAG TPA: hypothetical protein VK752_24175 [Bryobacteraceae bacterium]|jgi:hypothetical protein|nr:hypothetical protein [Bryobacteraceae bacterium]
MRRIFLFTLCSLALAQPPVAPTTEQTGNARGENQGNYNIIDSFEVGYRFASVGGDGGMYDSTVNYGDGIRLLSSSLTIQSRDGHGTLFDHLLLTTQGLGNDPYQSVILRIEKNRLYRYDMMWRLTDYVDPAATISFGEHAMNTQRTMQDHDLTLFPQSNFKLFLGYSRNLETGPALTTIQLFNSQGDEFPLFANVHREVNEYRLGGEVHLFGMRLNVMHGWEDYKENSPQSLTSPSAGNNPADLNTLASFQSTQPIHGTSPYWRVGLFREGKKLWAVNGRFTYVAGKDAFSLDEMSAGTDFRGTPTQLQVVSFGNADRPALTANLTLSIFPTDHIVLTNQSSFANIRMIGDSYFTEIENGSMVSPVLPFQYLGIRTFANTTDAMLHPTKWFSIHGGFEYSDRHIGSVQGQSNLGDPAPAQPAIEQSSQLKAGTLGFRVKPIKPLTISVDGEVGRTSKPFYPISDGNYQAFRARAEYKVKLFRVGAYAKSDYNINSDMLTSFASHARQYGADGSWIPTSWFSIDASYTKLHLNTLGGLNYFDAGVNVTGESSYYISNIHSANLSAHFTFLKRADIIAGYSHVQDVGDGRATPAGAGLYSALPAFQAAQTFPLRYLSPQVRLSIRITPKLRWNTGYQYYGYREQFSAAQDYRANTGFSSLAFSF